MKHKEKIFLLDDDELIVSMLSRAFAKEGYETFEATDPRTAVNKIKSWDPDIVLLDIAMPGKNGIEVLEDIIRETIDAPVVMLTSDDTAETAVKAMKIGAADYVTKPFNLDEVKIVISNTIKKANLEQEVNYLRKSYAHVFKREFIGESDAVKELRTKIQKMAQSRVSTILITGESGTGKELVSRRIHDLMFQTDNGRHAPFISINCAAMPESLLESELFGYEKGAFTDARSDKKGLFEEAKGGTILLDEIGDMKLDLQSKLLRVLEERTVRRIGGREEIPVDLTAIGTSNKNLSDAVKNGQFRTDLFFRLNTFYVHIVPLRERPEDILLIANYYLSYFTKKYNKRPIKGFSPEAEKLLMSYAWPGNVRELRNLVERFVVLESVEEVTPEQLPKWLRSSTGAGDYGSAKNGSSKRRFMLPDSGISFEEVEKDFLIQALEKAQNNQTLAAKLLGISYDTFRYKLKKFDLK